MIHFKMHNLGLSVNYTTCSRKSERYVLMNAMLGSINRSGKDITKTAEYRAPRINTSTEVNIKQTKLTKLTLKTAQYTF